MRHRTFFILVSLFVTLLLLGCSLESTYLGLYIESHSEALDQPASDDTTPVTFIIEPGQSIEAIANRLQREGLITDAELFRRYVQYKGLDAGIQAGSYTLNAAMTIPEIARTLQNAAAPDIQVTIPEGKRLEEVAVLVAADAGIDPQAFLQLVQTGWAQSDLVTRFDFLAQIPVTGTLEGFLFPDTYRLPQSPTANDLVERMLENFARQVTPEIQQGFADRGLSLFEGVTLASIVEREAVLDAERPVIAGVYLNRLRDGWPLAACPTVQYALGYRPDEGTWWKRVIYFVDLEVASPYNTYRTLGLPPGPIASPGAAAIQAAAFPAETPYYFFMVDCNKNDGSHLFAETEAEHLAHFEMCGGAYTTNP